MPLMRVTNNYPFPIYVFISKFTTPNGDDNWFYLAQGATETWTRQDGWEVIVAKNEDDTWRQGQYGRTDMANRELTRGAPGETHKVETVSTNEAGEEVREALDLGAGLDKLVIVSLPE